MRCLLRLAELEAARDGAAFVGTRHLPVAMAEQADAVPARVLARVVPDARRLRPAAALVWESGSGSARGRREPSILVRRAAVAARGEAERLGSSTIEPEHLLLALLAGGRERACGLIEELGLRLEWARVPVLRESAASCLDPEERAEAMPEVVSSSRPPAG